MSGDGSISASCPCVGIIDPGTIITMSVLIFLRLYRFSFFVETKLARPPKLAPPTRSPIPPPTPQPPSTPRKWSSPLHLGRLCRHLFSLFWQGFLRSSPLQPVYATRSPMLLRLPPLPRSPLPHHHQPPAYPHLFGAHPERGAAMCFSHSSLPRKTSGGVGGVDGRHFLT